MGSPSPVLPGAGRRRHGRRRLVLLVVVLVPVAALVVLAAVLALQLRHTTSLDYAEDPEYDIDQTVPGTGGGETIELVVLGDSTVAGLGAATIDDTLAVQTARELARRTGRPVHVVGHGVSGARTGEVLREQLPRVRDADVVMVEIGSNDTTHGTRMGRLERDTRALLREAGERAPVVVLGGSGRLDTHNFQRPLRDLVMWRARAVRGVQRDAARNAGVGFVDIGGDEIADAYARTKGADSPDDFHPAGPGYAVWARAFAAEIAGRL